MTGDDTPEVIVDDAAAWAAWLGERRARSAGVWLVLVAMLARGETIHPQRRRR